jgi:glutathione S-transferase
MSPYGSYEQVIETIIMTLSKGPYILGDTFTAADILWGTALHWTVGFKLVPPDPIITAYVDRIMSRPAVMRASQKDRELAAQQKA